MTDLLLEGVLLVSCLAPVEDGVAGQLYTLRTQDPAQPHNDTESVCQIRILPDLDLQP
jgi:hypothetical protein